MEAITDPAFNLHGHSATTHFAAPLIIVNGPIRTRIGLNCAAGVFGPGFRANATIAEEGWGKSEVRRHLFETIRRPYRRVRCRSRTRFSAPR